SPPNNVVNRRPAPAGLLPLWQEPLECTLQELGPLKIRQVRHSAQDSLFGQLIEEHHYLSYTQPVGEHLKYLVWARSQPIAALAWCSAARHLAARDRFIGWRPEVRKANLHLIAYNTRFMIVPWVRAPHLASHLLGRVARRISQDWEALYAHPVHLLETFIDPARFRGTCYRAANWQCLGLSTGRGHNASTGRRDQPRKELWVYPLSADFRRQLNPSSTDGALASLRDAD
ncbi:MAG TPA: Druantia anti-phage system protein DruA, partial [Verrucomicrobiales bacterium]|nr:Druantia anti-phage system protein DruA [Verrucomicrobiales bacterium]